jgi:hypothetical protein
MGETSVLSDSGVQSDQSVSRETFLSDWRAKPYKASDSGFAFKLVRSIDFFGAISGWRGEAQRRGMGEQNGTTSAILNHPPLPDFSRRSVFRFREAVWSL